MDDQMYERRFNGDPQKELEANCKNGEFRFKGIMDNDSKPGRRWVPGVADKALPSSELSGYMRCVHGTPWRAAAIRYFTAYNRALLARKRDKTRKEFDAKVDSVIAGAKSAGLRSSEGDSVHHDRC